MTVGIIGKMPIRKTQLMREAEDKLGQPLEKGLPKMLTDNGLTQTANDLEVSKATLGYWVLKLDITIVRVALAPGETVRIIKVPQKSKTVKRVVA